MPSTSRSFGWLSSPSCEWQLGSLGVNEAYIISCMPKQAAAVAAEGACT
jgi:hypothetical protein